MKRKNELIKTIQYCHICLSQQQRTLKEILKYSLYVQKLAEILNKLSIDMEVRKETQIEPIEVKNIPYGINNRYHRVKCNKHEDIAIGVLQTEINIYKRRKIIKGSLSCWTTSRYIKYIQKKKKERKKRKKK